MSRWIDADALMETLGIKSECVCCEYADEIFYCKQGSAFVDACEAINEAPSIDIVRCKECEHGTYCEEAEMYICSANDQDLYEAEHFCSYGEKKGGGSRDR